MKKMSLILISTLVVLLVITGIVVYKVLFSTKIEPQKQSADEQLIESLPVVDASVVVDVSKSTSKENTVIMKVSGMNSKMESVGYELTYESEGLIKGVNSGSKPIETSGKDEFEREIYLGTCSRNVCKPDIGVTKASIVLEFTDTKGKKSQFSKDYDL